MHLRRPLAVAAAIALAAGVTTSCSGDDEGDGNTPVTIATQNFPEANLVGALYDVLLSDNGYDVEVKAVDARDAYMSIFPQDVDIVPEYVAGIGDFLNTEANGEGATPITSNDTDASLEAVRPLAEARGITLLEPAEASSQNAFYVTQDYSDSEGVTKLSDLSGQSIVLAGSPDCKGRADCEGGLTEVYDIDVTKILPLGFASPEGYESVKSGESQLGLTGTIDPNLEDEGLVLLEDDLGIQPAQNLIPAVSEEFLADHDDVEGLLNDLSAALDNDTINELLGRMTIDREKAEDVAEDFLKEEGLI
ncbi:MAG: glycine betaine ABC transporter substrate-binding protein [Nocardioides sp.]|nr:glycine betaine ABC transporter substrate-binding protein [Nocardioides sp.]